jgi:hypothetical protein
MKPLLLPALLAMSLAACAPASQDHPAATVAASEPAAAGAPRPTATSDAAPQASSPPTVAVAVVDPAREAEIDARIDKVLGDHVAYRSVLERLQAAVSGDDRSGVAALARYPMDARTMTGKLHIENAQAFVAHYEDIVTPAVAQVIAAQRYGDLFVSQNGVMLGSGEVWINGVCHDPGCVDVDVKVVTFQQGS